jgi:hypothetical protein
MRGHALEGVSVVPEHPGGRAATTGPRAGTAKVEKMEKIVVRMEKFLVKVEKIIVYFWQDWSIYLEAVTRGLWSGHKERALRCLFRSEM